MFFLHEPVAQFRLLGGDDRNRADQPARIGVVGLAKTVAVGLSSTQLALLEHGDAVGDVADHRQIVGDEDIGQPALARRSSSNFSTRACTSTSSAEVGSSSTTNSDWQASARAIATRWRWPPDSDAGERVRNSGGRPHLLQKLPRTLGAAGFLADSMHVERQPERRADAALAG